MKKVLFFAAAVLALAACSNEEENANDNWNGEIRLTTQHLRVTRASSEIQNTQFDANEKIDIFIYNHADGEGYETLPAVYTADGNGNLTTNPVQQFPAGADSQIDLYGVYPSGIATPSDTANIAFTVQLDQSTEAGYKASDLMLGGNLEGRLYQPITRTNDPVLLTFVHKLSKIILRVVPGVGLSDTSFEGATASINNVLVTTRFNISNIQLPMYYSAEGDPATINMGSLEAGGTEAAPSYRACAIIVPQEFEGGTQLFTINLNGRSFTYTTTPDYWLTFESGRTYEFTITANVWGLSLSTVIQNWETGQTITGQTD